MIFLNGSIVSHPGRRRKNRRPGESRGPVRCLFRIPAFAGITILVAFVVVVLDCRQRLFEVGDQVVDVFDADRQANGIDSNASGFKFRRRKLAVRGRCRMAGQ